MTFIALALITSPGITGRIAGGQDTVTLEHTCPNDLETSNVMLGANKAWRTFMAFLECSSLGNELNTTDFLSIPHKHFCNLSKSSFVLYGDGINTI